MPLTEDQLWQQFDTEMQRTEWVPTQVEYQAFDSTVAPVEIRWHFVRRDELARRGAIPAKA